MAKLCRLVKLNDSFNTQVFTFMLPNKVLREFSQDIYAKDMVYGHHKWTVSFIKSEKHMGAYIKLQSTSTGMVSKLDFSFTMLNNDHFTKNESFMEKEGEFTYDENVKGRKTFVPLEDMAKRGFMQGNGEFLVELELRNIVSSFECYLRIPKENNSRHSYGPKMETPYFSFGLSDWSVSLFPNACTVETEDNITVQLVRHTNFDHICDVKYQLSLGDQNAYESGPVDQLLDATGNSEPFTVGASLMKLSRGRSSLKVRIEMQNVVSVSEVSINVLSRNRNRAHLYDKDKQAWMLEADASGKYLAFKLYYTDIKHVPRKNSRYVAFNLGIVPYSGNQYVRAINGPFVKYYVQDDHDDGYLIHTDIPIEEISSPDNDWVSTEDQHITVHVEWIDSQLLIYPTYHRLDDVARVHKQQMIREILALQSENYALEKQLYSYQQSIAKTNSKPRSLSEDRGNSYRRQ
ncbi:uncharacterized protein [Mytilus edulis]|uniref:MATH domain-containing protein n=1 Tax=Mytilus galloprovincialis TaxID=29158 RepID=A0A8B6DXM8_MYTGA|nr:Hypothetical predicted protein [Mytilus galloprovincialis]